MDNLRIYGQPPFDVALIHGGPGAAGEMEPVARILSAGQGVLEPLQTADSVEGQIQELRETLEANGTIPLTLIGFSWGAWLGCMLAAVYPNLVKKLILVSSGAFEERYAQRIMDTRLSRLSVQQKDEVRRLMEVMEKAEDSGNETLRRFGYLMSVADTFKPTEEQAQTVECTLSIYKKVWRQTHMMRKNGTLLTILGKIGCPVVAIHGDYDPTPVDGVRIPLLQAVSGARVVVLEKCGHRPWCERYAKDQFFQILFAEI